MIDLLFALAWWGMIAAAIVVAILIAATMAIELGRPAGGYVVQWQRSTDDGATWTDIPGETNVSYGGAGR